MTFKQIVDAVLRNLFDESDRGDAKDWINHRYGWLLAVDEWEFLNGTDTVTVTANSMTVGGLPSDFGIAVGLLNSAGEPLEARSDWIRFYEDYQGAGAGTPEAFTVVGGVLLVGPKPTGSATDWTLLYEKEPVPLAADGDIPVIPELFHVMLVHGGRAEGMKMQHNPAWQAVEQDFIQAVDAMRRRYLTSVRGAAEQYPAYRV